MTYKCSISGEALSPERVEALLVLGVPETNWTSVKHSQVKKLRGVYAGDDGSNDIVICDSVDGGSLFDSTIVAEAINES